MTQKLSNKKEAWVKQFKPTHIVGSPLPNNASLESKTSRSIVKLTNAMLKETNKELRKLFKTDTSKAFFAEDASLSSQARIVMNALKKKYIKIFNDQGKLNSKKLVNDANNLSKSTTHNSLEQLSGGLSIKTSDTSSKTNDIMKASISQSVSFISSIQEKYLTDVEGAVMRSITSGQGLKDLIPFLRRFDGITQRRAKNIALDQTRKTYNAVNAQRLQNAGVNQFRWRHSGGSLNPRKDHVAMDGDIYSYDDLPVIDKRTGERGLPGQAPNCKCYQEPVIVFDKEVIDNG